MKFDIWRIPWRYGGFSIKWERYIKLRYRKALANIVAYIYNKIIIPILRYNFYIT